MAVPGLPQIQFQKGIPRKSIAPAAERIRRPDPVLVYGALPPRLESDIGRSGGSCVQAHSRADALRLLSTQSFLSVALDVLQPDALELVKIVKLGAGVEAAQDDDIWIAGSLHASTPFVILPFWVEGDTEYAVIVAPPTGAFLERVENVPLLEVLLYLDVRPLLPKPEKAS